MDKKLKKVIQQILKKVLYFMQNYVIKIINQIFYNIIKKIGEGVQGIVLLRRNKITKEFVAIKKIKQQTQSGQKIKRVFQEQIILKVLDHKNIVKLYQSYSIQNKREIIMIMEYLNGGSLLKQANSQLTEGDVKLYSKQIIDAIVYCDLKLENIIDFGLSTYAGQQKQTDSIVGTLSYLAPETLSSQYKNIQPQSYQLDCCQSSKRKSKQQNYQEWSIIKCFQYNFLQIRLKFNFQLKKDCQQQKICQQN